MSWRSWRIPGAIRAGAGRVVVRLARTFSPGDLLFLALAGSEGFNDLPARYSDRKKEPQGRRGHQQGKDCADSVPLGDRG